MKPRIDAGKSFPLRELKRQPEAVQSWAFNLRESLTQKQAIDAIAAKTGIRLCAPKAYTQFCQYYSAKLDLDVKWDTLNHEAEAAEAWFATNMPDATPEERRAKIIERTTLMLAANRDPQGLEPLAAFLRRWQQESKLTLDSERIAIDQRKLKLLEDQAAKADKAKEITASDSTLEEKQRQMRLLFGMA